MLFTFQSITFPNSFLLHALFTTLIITSTLIFDSVNKEKIKDNDMSTWEHAVVLFCLVLAISLSASYMMYFIFSYGGGNLTPCQKVIKCNNEKSLSIPHYINIIIMIICFIITFFIYKKVKLKNV